MAKFEIQKGSIVRKPNGDEFRIDNPNDPALQGWLADAELVHEPSTMGALGRGFERGVSTTLRGADQLLGTDMSSRFYSPGEDDIKEREFRRYLDSNTGAAITSNIAGNVVDPIGFLIPGGLGAKAAGLAGAGRVVAGAAGGALAGAIGGFTDPVYEEYGDSRTVNTAAGTVLGSGLGAAMAKWLGKAPGAKPEDFDKELTDFVEEMRSAPGKAAAKAEEVVAGAQPMHAQRWDVGVDDMELPTGGKLKFESETDKALALAPSSPEAKAHLEKMGLSDAEIVAGRQELQGRIEKAFEGRTGPGDVNIPATKVVKDADVEMQMRGEKLAAESNAGMTDAAVAESRARYKVNSDADSAQIGRRTYVDANGEQRPLTYGMLGKLADPEFTKRNKVLESIYGRDNTEEEDSVRKLFAVAQNRLKKEQGTQESLDQVVAKLSKNAPDAAEILANRPKTGALSEAEATYIAADVVKATQEMPVLVSQVSKMLSEGKELTDAALKPVIEALNKNAAVMLMWQGNKRAASRTLNQLKRVKAAQQGSQAQLDSIFGGFKC